MNAARAPVFRFVRALWLCLPAVTALAQSPTARFLGGTYDIQGLPIPTVRVTVLNNENGLRRATESNGAGIYMVPLLPPGSYDITAEKEGFKAIVHRNVKLDVQDTVRVDFTFAPNDVRETIEVTDAMIESVTNPGMLQLQKQSGERSAVLTSLMLRETALNGRNVFDLFRTLPGVIADPSYANSGLTGVSRLHVNGTRSGMSEFSIDGAISKNTGDMLSSGVSINPDAISEVRIVSSNYQAEYGVAGGANIQMVLKSGGNDFHGSVRYFRRHESLNANSFFNKVVTPNEPRPIYRYNYTGFEAGGPVVAPGVFNGKDRLFFYWNEEFYGQIFPTARHDVWMPTDLQRAGDFSNTTDGNGNLVAIRDPLAGAQFPDNRIPASRIYAPGASTLKIFPEPNVSDDPRYNYSSQASDHYSRREDIVRVDFQANQMTRLSAHVINNHDKRKMPYGQPYSSWPSPLSMGGYSQPGQNMALSVTHIFNPAAGNDLTVAYQRLHVDCAPLDNNLSRQVNGISTPLLYPDALRLDASPTLAFGGISNWDAPYLTTGYPFHQSMPIANVIDNLTAMRGAHSFKAGFYAHFAEEVSTKTANEQTQSRIDFSANAANSLDSGHPFANALLGVYSAYSQSATWVDSTLRYHNFEVYGQDSWRVRRGLTVDFGLRLVNAPPGNDAQWSRPFYADLYQSWTAPRLYTPTLLSTGERRAVDPGAVPASPNLTNTFPVSYAGLVVPGSGNISNGTMHSNGSISLVPEVLPAPRFGFAYSPLSSDKLVLRGGAGVSYDRTRTSVYGSSTINPPNGILTSLQYGWLQDIGSMRDEGLTTGAPAIAGAFARHSTLPAVFSYSLGLQAYLGTGVMLDVAFVGNAQRHLAQVRDLNATPYGTMFTRAAQDPSLYAGGVVPAVEPDLPAAYSAAGLSFSGRYALPTDLRRPYPGLGTINYRSFDGSANYNSLQVTLNRRFARVVVAKATYTWSKTLGTSWDDQTGSVSAFDTRGHDYALAPFDRTHTLVVNYVLSLPSPGGRWKASRLARGALDGWQISGVTTAYTGTPYQLAVGIAGAGGWAITGSDTEGPVFLRKASAGTPAGMHIDPKQFVAPELGSQGYGPRQYLRAPGFVEFDAALIKNFRYSAADGRYLQLRLEMFNMPNHALFNSVNSATNLTSPSGATGIAAFESNPASLSITNNLRPSGSTKSLGTYFGEYNGALSSRVIQLAVKLYF